MADWYDERNQGDWRRGREDASDVDVQVSEGVVTLTGQVDDRFSSRHIEDLLDNVMGVKDVRNQLKANRQGNGEHGAGR